jgi:hypothetical protein
MPVALGFLILDAAGVSTIGGFAVTASTAAIVGNIPLAGNATEIRRVIHVLRTIKERES